MAVQRVGQQSRVEVPDVRRPVSVEDGRGEQQAATGPSGRSSAAERPREAERRPQHSGGGTIETTAQSGRARVRMGGRRGTRQPMRSRLASGRACAVGATGAARGRAGSGAMSGAMSCCRLAAAALRPLSSVQRGRSAAGEWGRGGPGSARASPHLPASGGMSGTGPVRCERSATRARSAEQLQRVLTQSDRRSAWKRAALGCGTTELREGEHRAVPKETRARPACGLLAAGFV